MIEFLNENKKGILGVRFSGKITREDYEAFVRRADEVIRERGQLNTLLDLSDLSSMELGAALQDLKFTTTRLPKFRRFAVVGDESWIGWIAKISDLLPGVEARRFGTNQTSEAWIWVGEADSGRAAS